MNKKLFSTSEVARLLGVSRQAIFKKIKAGELKAKKIGRNFIINEESLNEILGKTLAGEQKQKIEKSVERTISEYGETLKLLGQE